MKTVKSAPLKSNYAFIDGNNLYLGIKNQGIKLDYRKFRLYLKNKFHVDKAFLFIGYDETQSLMYQALQSYGFILVFKPTVAYTDEKGKRQMKGNVDAELVLQASAIDFNNYNQAIIVSSDGDFACLMRFLEKHGKLARIITPTQRYSKLLSPFRSYITRLDNIKSHLLLQPPSISRHQQPRKAAPLKHKKDRH